MGTGLERHTSESFGFRFLGPKTGIKLFDSPVDYEKGTRLAPLQLLHVGNAKQIYAASNTECVGVGKLKDLDDPATATDNFVFIPFTGVSFVRFNCTSEYLYIIAEEKLHRASVDDFFSGKSYLFTLIDTKGPVRLFEPHYSNPLSYFYITFDDELIVTQDDIETSLFSRVTAATWNYFTAQLGIVTDDTLKVGNMTYKQEELLERTHLISVSCLARNTWYVTGLQADDEDPIHTMITITDSCKMVPSEIPVFPPALFKERYPTVYCASVVNWIEDTTFSFLSYFLSPDICAVEIGAENRFLEPENDTDRAELPLDEETNDDTFPVGLTVDIFGVDTLVEAPCISLELASGVLPRVLCLNNQGHLFSWYFYEANAINEDKASLRRAIDEFSAISLQSLKAQPRKEVNIEQNSSSKKFEEANDIRRPQSIEIPKDDTRQPIGEMKKLYVQPDNCKTETNPLAQLTGSKFGKTGFGHSGFGQTGFGQTGFGQPGMNSSGSSSGGSGSPAFGRTSFGSTGFGQTGFATASAGKPLFGATGAGTSTQFQSSTGSMFGQYTKFGSNAGSSPFRAMESKENIFGGSGDSPFALLSQKNTIFGDSNGEANPVFGGSSKQKHSPFASSGLISDLGDAGDTESIFAGTSFGKHSTETKSSFGSISQSKSTLTGVDQKDSGEIKAFFDNSSAFASAINDISKDGTSQHLGALESEPTEDKYISEETGEDLSEPIDDEYTPEKIGEEASDPQADESGSEVRSVVDDSNWVDIESSSVISEDLLSMISKPVLSKTKNYSENPKDSERLTDSRGLTERKWSSKLTESDHKRDLVKGHSDTSEVSSEDHQKEASEEPAKSSSTPKSASSEKAAALKKSSRESSELAKKSDASSSKATDAEADFVKAKEKKENDKEDGGNTKILPSKPSSTAEKIPQSKLRKHLAEVLSDVKFVKFGGYTHSLSPDNSLAGKMTEIIRAAQAQLDILEINAEYLKDIYDAYSQNDPEPRADLTALVAVRPELTLAAIPDLEAALQKQQEIMSEGIAASEKLNCVVSKAVDDFAAVYEIKEDLAKTLQLMALFLAWLSSSLCKSRPMSLQAEHLRLKLRRNIVRVEQLHAEVLKKLVPLRIRNNLGVCPAARASKVENVVRQIMAKNRAYSLEIQELEGLLKDVALIKLRKPEKEESRLVLTGGISKTGISVRLRLRLADAFSSAGPRRAQVNKAQ